MNIESLYYELCLFFHLWQKRNARFRASLLIERSGSWHLGTGKRSRSTALTFEKCTSLNIVHKFIHSSAFLAILTNCMLLSFNILLCSLQIDAHWYRLWFRREGSLQTWLICYSWHILEKKLEIRSSNTTVLNSCYHSPCSVEDYALVCATVKTSHTHTVMIDTFHEKASARLLETTNLGETRQKVSLN